MHEKARRHFNAHQRTLNASAVRQANAFNNGRYSRVDGIFARLPHERFHRV